MGSVGFGKTLTGHLSAPGLGNYFMAEGRFIPRVNDDESLFIFSRFENYPGNFDNGYRIDKGLMFAIGLGVM